jgi:hypothetical protein
MCETGDLQGSPMITPALGLRESAVSRLRGRKPVCPAKDVHKVGYCLRLCGQLPHGMAAIGKDSQREDGRSWVVYVSDRR